jgi:hypothetical protein
VFMFSARVILIAGNKDGELPFLFLDIFEDISLESKLNGRIRRFLVIFIVGFILFGHLYLNKMGSFIITCILLIGFSTFFLTLKPLKDKLLIG